MIDIAFKSEMTPLVIAHIGGGTIGILAGITALFSRKGSLVHRAAGTSFVIAMGIGAASAAYLAYRNGEFINSIGGVLTLYFIATAYVAAKRPDGKIGVFEVCAFLFAATGAAIGFYATFDGVQKGTAFMSGIPGYGFASVVGLCALFDLSVILRRGLAGRQRIARHLWRMHLGFFVAAGSFFPGQLHLFPEYIREIRPVIILFIPPLSIFALMFFWLARVLFTRWWRDEPEVGAKD